MKTKHKRLIIIGSCIAWGMFSLYALDCDLLLSLFGESKAPNALGMIFFLSCALIIRLEREFDLYSQMPEPFLTLTLFMIQFVVYAIIGIIISYAAYAPWRKTKPLPESTAPPEPDK